MGEQFLLLLWHPSCNKLEEGDNKRTALENEQNDLKKQLQNSRDQLKRAQSE
jgi:hypothetical protein